MYQAFSREFSLSCQQVPLPLPVSALGQKVDFSLEGLIKARILRTSNGLKAAQNSKALSGGGNKGNSMHGKHSRRRQLSCRPGTSSGRTIAFSQTAGSLHSTLCRSGTGTVCSHSQSTGSPRRRGSSTRSQLHADTRALSLCMADQPPGLAASVWIHKAVPMDVPLPRPLPAV